MIAVWTLFTQEKVLADTPVELFGMLSIIALLGGAYRKVECHQHGCHRLGRFDHGHFKLCRVHHPHVPSKGRIGKEHIDEMTQRKAIEPSYRPHKSEGSE